MLSIVLAGSAFAPQLTPPQLHTAGRAAVFASAEGAERKFARAPNLLDLGDEKVTARQIVNVLGRWTTHTQWWEGIGVSVNLEAILNDPSSYEILDPADFGLDRYVHVAHRLTGWNAIKSRVEQLRLELTDAQIKEITAHIKALADEKPLSLSDVDTLLRSYHTAEPVPAIAGAVG